MPNRRRRKISTAMSAVGALAVATPFAVLGVLELSSHTATEHREFTRAAVVTQPGALDFLHDFNRRGVAALEHWSRHATGGLAGLPAPAFPIPESLGKSPRNARDGGKGGNVHVLNFIDRDELLKAAMATPAGDRFVINAVMRNKRSLGMG